MYKINRAIKNIAFIFVIYHIYSTFAVFQQCKNLNYEKEKE